MDTDGQEKQQLETSTATDTWENKSWTGTVIIDIHQSQTSSTGTEFICSFRKEKHAPLKFDKKASMSACLSKLI